MTATPKPPQVKISYALSHLRAAATVLEQEGRQDDADEIRRIADRIETERFDKLS